MAIPKLRYLSSTPFLPITHPADQRDRTFDIADVPFTAVPPEEMKLYTANIKKFGHYDGYKARKYWASRFPSPICPSSSSRFQCRKWTQRTMSSTRLSSMGARNSSCMLSVTLAEAVQVNRDVTKRPHPQALRPFFPELGAFARHNHFNVLHPILR